MKICPKCKEPHHKKGAFCSRSCANSRGPRTQEFKDKVSKKMKGRPKSDEYYEQARIIRESKITMCNICGKSTDTIHRLSCSDECLQKLMIKNSRENPKCGGQKHTHRSRIVNINGEEFASESSYEANTANILNDINVLWNRPECLFYTDGDGNKRRYHPDFYLPYYDLYLDPKNSYLIKTDVDKIQRASIENDKTIFIIGVGCINEESISSMINNRSGYSGVAVFD